MTRLYFNRRGEFPWSTDNGPGTPEVPGALKTITPDATR